MTDNKGESRPLVQNFHQSAAAEGNNLAGLDMNGFVAGDAVDIGVVGGADLGDGHLFLFAEALDVENSGAVLGGDINANGLQLLGVADAVAQLDPQRFQLSDFRG